VRRSRKHQGREAERQQRRDGAPHMHLPMGWVTDAPDPTPGSGSCGMETIAPPARIVPVGMRPERLCV
jgi:hypothetical protein